METKIYISQEQDGKVWSVSRELGPDHEEWPKLVEHFLKMLQGIDYKLPYPVKTIIRAIEDLDKEKAMNRIKDTEEMLARILAK